MKNDGSPVAGRLCLADGTSFEGELFGSTREGLGEVVFTTGMTGYQEVLTDPSYTGQIVCMTAPHIGNTGVNALDPESVSSRPQVAGLVVGRSRPRAIGAKSPCPPGSSATVCPYSAGSTPAA